ncbi:MAG: sensor histidine kinase [Tannerellaceae bacterium]|jgi:signal transduction histidine kinase|nr:sensor histidine kinase [Tannerellaceae bacterium]
MPDFNIKDLEVLSKRIKWVEKITMGGIALVVVAFYLNYSGLAWSLFLALIILYVVKGRLNRQLKQKQYLAKAVEERTIELRVQRDQVLMESEKLSSALAALAEAQDELIRQERYATVGQLTKGLVDRILNPLNYINNFAGISSKLIHDLRNILEKDIPLNPETDDEVREILDMIDGNLRKISEHGANTVRIVKAMEELLKDRKGKMSIADINNLCRLRIDEVKELYAAEIEEKQIRIAFHPLPLSIMIDINIEQMSKAVRHLLENSLYALSKKAAKDPGFKPQLSVSLLKEGDNIDIKIRDNGSGIEDSIKDRIFEPFFTTKPTAEAAGTGLYISREIVHNHKGTISVSGEKDRFTEFVVSVPIHQHKENNE